MKKLVLLLAFLSAQALSNVPAKMTTDVIINLPIEKAWNLFSTADGWKDIGYSATISMKPGGSLQARKDNETIDGFISSFDPERMLSWQWSNSSCWSVLYFNAMGNDMTQIQWTDFCAETAPSDLDVRAQRHRQLFDQLVRRYAPECHVCKEEREAATHQ